ncbi:hypothetical protein BGW38_000996 [Lunasporangiospora selenospora]|uniref:F-box domain-containing protein n=1 Tax=Lunasporangiospora selenospora TaxID=979761 RepID=A0A9P6G2C1_9FUNG|nr:hypothetical protein BGW38_000996 [Lunasporangiospora selenospora]
MDLPEILAQVGLFLDHNDLVACIRVSHGWNNVMQPLIWRRIVVHQASLLNLTTPTARDQSLALPLSLGTRASSPSPPSSSPASPARTETYPSTAVILENARRVHTLIFNIHAPSLVQELVPLLNNQLVQLQVLQYSDDIKHILLANSSTLVHFKCLYNAPLPLTATTPERVEHATGFWDTIAQLPKLRGLELSGAFVYEDHDESFFSICCRLSSLVLKSCRIYTRFRPGTSALPQLRRLEMTMNALASDAQFAFITLCPNLTHLAWNTTGSIPSHSFLRYLSMRNPQCPIECLDLSGTALTDGELANILSHLTLLKRFYAAQSFVSGLCCHFITTSKTDLEELILRGCTLLESSMIQSLLMSLPKLRRFAGYVLKTDDMNPPLTASKSLPLPKLIQNLGKRSLVSSMRLLVPTGSSSVAGISNGGPTESTSPRVNDSQDGEWSSKWVCLELEELDVTFSGFQDPSTNGMQIIFEQLSALTMLRKLVLRDYCSYSSFVSQKVPTTTLGPQMRIYKGMSKLAPLKQLRMLDVQWIPLDMTLDDVKWMVQQWPRLRHIRGVLTCNPREYNRIEQFLEQDYPEIRVEGVYYGMEYINRG